MHRLAPIMLALVALLIVAAPASAADPIEGTWHFAGGQVRVEPTGPGTFKGTVVKATRFAVCDHPAGQRMWEITRMSDGAYEGTHVWYTDDGCAELPGGRSLWRVREEAERFTLDFCTRRAGDGAPSGFSDGECSSLARAKPPAPRPTQVCSGDACLSPPADATAIGCLRRTVRHRFSVQALVRRGGRRVASVRSVVFRLDGRRIGSDRRPPFVATVAGSRLRPGSHELRAEVSLRSTRTGRRVTRRLTYRFGACER